MKNIIYPLFLVLGFSACKKDNKTDSFSTTGNGSIIQDQSIVTNSGSAAKFETFNGQDSTIVFGLMNKNKLSRDGFVFYQYQSYTTVGAGAAFVQIAMAKQVSNHLPVFSSDVEFAFDNGIISGPPPVWSVGNITLDNTPHLSLQSLRNIFIK